MARILPLYIIAGFIAVALAVFIALILTQDAVAQTEQGSLACVDSNNNGRVDISELFDVIDLYFSGDPITTPDTTPTPTPTVAPTLTPTPTMTPTPTPTRDGTSRSKAFEYGEEFDAGIFNMQIVAIDTDAWPEIQAENSLNDPPADGHKFVMWTLDVENARGSTDEYEWAYRFDFALVGSNNVLYYPFNEDATCGVFPDPLNERLYLDGTGTGNVCLSVPVDEINLTFLYDALHKDANGDSFFVEVWFDATDWR